MRAGFSFAILTGMTLAAHAATGALLAAFVPQYPAAAFSLGFASHFLLDAIPHWDYKLYSLSGEEDPLGMKFPLTLRFAADLVKIGFDFLLGIFVGCVLFPALLGFPLTFAVAVGAISATLPDFLTFLYTKYPRGILRSIMIFHMSIHAKLRLKNWKDGAAYQAAVVAIFACVFFFIRR